MGSTASALARATRCRCPPDSSDGRRLAKFSNCTSVSRRITLSAIAFLSGRIFRGRTRSPKATFSNTLMCLKSA